MLEKDIASRKVLCVVIVVETRVDRGIELLKVDKLVRQNVAPDCLRKGVVQMRKLQVRDGTVNNLFSRKAATDLEGLGKVPIGLGRRGDILEVGRDGEHRLRDSPAFDIVAESIEDVGGVVIASGSPAQGVKFCLDDSPRELLSKRSLRLLMLRSWSSRDGSLSSLSELIENVGGFL